MATRMQQRRGTAADWAAQNPILADGELGFEIDTKVIKMGDGATRWNDLTMPYLTAGGGVMTGPLSLVAPTQNAHGARLQDLNGKVNKSGDTMTGSLSITGGLTTTGLVLSSNPRVWIQSSNPGTNAKTNDIWGW